MPFLMIGQVIKGWDKGIITMKKVENAILTIPLELAYGELGSTPTIPPNAITKGKKWDNPKELDEVLGIQFCILNFITL